MKDLKERAEKTYNDWLGSKNGDKRFHSQMMADFAAEVAKEEAVAFADYMIPFNVSKADLEKHYDDFQTERSKQ